MKDLGMTRHIIPLTAPVQKTATFVSPNVSMKTFESVQFIVAFGAIATDGFVLTVTCSAVTAGSSATAIDFKYRLSAAAGTDTMGDVSAAVSSLDCVHDGAFDNACVIIDIDANQLTADKPYVGITLTDPGSADAIVGIVAIAQPRYPCATPDGALT